MTRVSTITNLFGLWKTIPEMAEAIGESHWTVEKWKQRRRIPNGYWPAVISAARLKGKRLTADDLLAMHSTKAPVKAAAYK
jgi:hypothetical protein